DGECADTATLTIEVGDKVVPTFDPIAAICEGETLASLPTISTNGIEGTWLPTLDNILTTEYTFTPADGECADTATLTIEVGDKVVPTFDPITAICEGETLAALPTISTNGIEGTWSPALDNTQTTEYTFTSADGECADTATLTIEVGDKVVPAFDAVAAICEGEILAELPMTSINGIEGTWSPVLDNTQTTEYTFTPADGECADTAIITIIVNPLPIAEILGILEICSGSSTVLTASGGETYVWNTEDTTTAITVDAAGDYTVTVMDSSGCTGVATVTVIVNDNTNPEIVGDNTYCYGDDGVILDAGANYESYLWYPNGETTQTIIADGGSYQVTVTNMYGCESVSDVFTVNTLAMLSCDIVQDELASNYLNADGVASVIGIGGSGVYTYLWDNGETTSTASALNYGLHSVTISDDECGETTCEIFISKNLICNVTMVAGTSCIDGADGVATVQALGGYPPYTYSWNGSSFTDDATNSNLSSGSNSVVVKDATGAISECAVQISSENAEIGCSITQDNLASNYLASDGAATVNATGGSGSFSYLWDNGETSATAIGLTYGLHSVLITDQNGCGSSTCNIFIAKNLICSTNVVSQVSNLGEDDGVASVQAYGGYPPYLYSWDGGNYVAENTVNNLSAGSHTVTVKDSKGAITQCSVTLNSDQSQLDCSIVQDELASNYMSPDGIATVNVTGGAGDYSYLWDNGEITKMATMLTYGVHSVTVTDISGNTTTCELFISKNLICSLEMISGVTCSDGADGVAKVQAYGGFAPYSYSWDGLSYSNNDTGSNLSAGNHTVTVKDSKGSSTQCSVIISSDNAEIGCSIFQNRLTTNYLTADGEATVSATGGSGNYSYLWDNGETSANAIGLTYGVHSVIITDLSGCGSSTCEIFISKNLICSVQQLDIVNNQNSQIGSAKVEALGGLGEYYYAWDNGETTAIATNLTNGLHTVTVSDSNGNSTTCSIQINLYEELTCSVVVNNNISTYQGQDGKITVMPQGGCGPYTFQWSNGEQFASIGNLSTGYYSVVIKDSKGTETECTIELTTSNYSEEVCDGMDNDGDGDIDEGFDADQDGIADCEDDCTGDSSMDSDGDGIPDACDVEQCDGNDNDGDGYIDEGFDTDQDGVADCEDDCDGDNSMDSDGDGIPDACDVEECDGIDNNGDGGIDEGFDADQDGVSDCEDTCMGDNSMDSDGDGIPDACDVEQCDGIDNDGDGYVDEGFDTDQDGVADCEDECDGDNSMDSDGDGIPDACDVEECDGIDNNGDGLIDENLNCESDSIEGCETAYGYLDNTNSTCFIDDDLGANRWGWSNYINQEGSYIMDLYAGAGRCDISAGTKVGEVSVLFENGFVTIDIELLDNYQMNATHIWIGGDKYPLGNNGRPTVANGQLPYGDDTLSNVTNYSLAPVNVSSFTNGMFVIVHADVCSNDDSDSGKFKSSELTAYPNSFKEELNLELNTNYDSRLSIEIFDLNGKLIKQERNHDVVAGVNYYNVLVGNLEPGMFIVILKTNKEKFVKKVISKK
ncbi:T9SS type A sorting domain-containing protein, partial [Maribacter sp. 1_MG-2023]|uniref:T9SS type A sorting domain-containing protein n=1 Tax=Maribacter sp. 1_MG-2023 TaxID=3062677 RepID=UPI0026E39CE2